MNILRIHYEFISLPQIKYENSKIKKYDWFLEKPVFMGNVCRMRRALVAYLEEGGIKAKVEDGLVEFEYDQCTFSVDFIY